MFVQSRRKRSIEFKNKTVHVYSMSYFLAILNKMLYFIAFIHSLLKLGTIMWCNQNLTDASKNVQPFKWAHKLTVLNLRYPGVIFNIIITVFQTCQYTITYCYRLC